MSIRESLFALTKSEHFQRNDVDLSELTGVEGQKGVMIEMTLGERGELEKFIDQNKAYYRAAYIVFCLYEANKDNQLVRVFQNNEIDNVMQLPWQSLDFLFEEALDVCGLLKDEAKFYRWLVKKGISQDAFDGMSDADRKALEKEHADSQGKN